MQHGDVERGRPGPESGHRRVRHDAWLSGPGVEQEIVTRFTEAGWAHTVHHQDRDFVLDTVRRGLGGPA